MPFLLDEAVKGVRHFLDGHHQVTYLGKHGHFHLYSAVNVHDDAEGMMNRERYAAADPQVLKAHLSKIHTPDAIGKLHTEARAWSEANETDTASPHPPHIPVFYDRFVDHEDHSTDIIHAAKEATKHLKDAGLPSQDRHVVLMDQSKQMNQNTGISGDIGGHWDKHKHVIAINRKADVGPGGTTKTLVHEWAHAFHDEMHKSQKTAWRNFYQNHVAHATSPAGTKEDAEKFKSDFVDHYMRNPDSQVLDKNIKARENAVNPNADMRHSVHRDTPDWWKGMAHGGHLSDFDADENGVKTLIRHSTVAQTSHTLHGYSDPNDKSTRRAIRANSYVNVRAVHSFDPVDKAHMDRNLFQPHEDQHLLAVSPVGKPHHVAIVDTRSLKFHPSDGSPKVGTHLRYDEEKSSKQPMPMNSHFKSDTELLGSPHKTVKDYVEYRKSRGAINVHNAVEAALTHAKTKNPGAAHSTNAAEDIAKTTLDYVSRGIPHREAVHTAVRYNVYPREVRTDLEGAALAPERTAAHDQKRVFKPYGASNDHELFATTAEHVAKLKREPISSLHPNHRKLVKAWHSMINGEKLESQSAVASLLERISRHLSESSTINWSNDHAHDPAGLVPVQDKRDVNYYGRTSQPHEMKVEHFLHLNPKRKLDDRPSGSWLRNHAASGGAIANPVLFVDKHPTRPGEFIVTGHEGRGRALLAAEQGHTHIPVQIRFSHEEGRNKYNTSGRNLVIHPDPASGAVGAIKHTVPAWG